MLARRILCAALAAVFLLAVVVPAAEGGKMKKWIAASVLVHALKPRFKPIPIPLPIPIKIKKGERYMPYPVQSDYGMMGGYGGGMGGYGGGMMGMGGSGY